MPFMQKILRIACLLMGWTLAAAHDVCDVVIYGGTSSGILAAVELASRGKTVLVIEPSHHVGGMSTSGLGWVDASNPDVLGKRTLDFFHRIWLHYEKPKSWVWEQPHLIKGQVHNTLAPETLWVFEPHVAENVFLSMIAEAGVRVVFNERLNRKNGVDKKNNKIERITMESGKSFAGHIFIDASYEGDLMASAGIDYTIGREANTVYGETLNGIHYNVRRADLPQRGGIDPYIIPKDPNSGLLPRIEPFTQEQDGEGDFRIQAYNYRMCLTDVPENSIPIQKPEQYREIDYELVFRALALGMPWDRFFKLDLLPNRKTDSNNASGISTDFIGMNYHYIESSYKEREKIALAHKNWQLGLVWTLQYHPRVPVKIRRLLQKWGLAKDEFIDNDHWPYQLYIREGRRMLGEHVTTENTLMDATSVHDPIAFCTYAMDSHIVRYIEGADHCLGIDGALYKPLPAPGRISYRSIVPKQQQCENLIVPVCLSASHPAYGSIRMEPVFMTLGERAAIAASIAIDLSIPVQQVPYQLLKRHW